MHLLETDFPRIYATEDASRRWADPWFPVIEEYVPKDRSIAVVSVTDEVMAEATRSLSLLDRFLLRRAPRLYHKFNEFAKAAVQLMAEQERVPGGLHRYDPYTNLSVLLVRPTPFPYVNNHSLLHECGHAIDLPEELLLAADWVTVARREIKAEAFAYKIYEGAMAGGHFQTALANASITEAAFVTDNPYGEVHLPGSGLYLQAAQGSDADMLNMRKHYMDLHERIRQALGYAPENAQHLMDGAQMVLDRTPPSAPIVPYAEHLLQTQKFALAMD